MHDPKSLIDEYCDAWNRGDLDAIFGLFAEGALYEGSSIRLTGRNAIREMYERTFSSGEANELVARTAQSDAGEWLVEIYRRDERVAVKRFEIMCGLIVRQSMLIPNP